jgi:uncharacterized membrane protein
MNGHFLLGLLCGVVLTAIAGIWWIYRLVYNAWNES